MDTPRVKWVCFVLTIISQHQNININCFEKYLNFAKIPAKADSPNFLKCP